MGSSLLLVNFDCKPLPMKAGGIRTLRGNGISVFYQAVLYWQAIYLLKKLKGDGCLKETAL